MQKGRRQALLIFAPVKQGEKSRLRRILGEWCPRCGKTKVFEKPPNPFKLPRMRERCEACGYKFDREPGYFLGAMYISYALSVLWGLITFFVLYFFFPDLPTIAIPITILLVILLLSIKSWKLSRIIYMHIFPW